jgi:Sulfotransferase family
VAAATKKELARRPDFFVVGHPKSGTTALYRMLSGHRQIFMPPLKETRFFAPELRSRFWRLGPNRLPSDLEEYLQLFEGVPLEQRAGEASPSYLRSHTAAARIAEVQPDARIVAILREPIDFLRSFHLQLVHNYTETEKDFARALRLEPARRDGRKIPRFSQSPEALIYSDHVRYVEQLRRYHDAFSRENVLVLVYDDFRRENERTIREVLRFLEVDEKAPIDVAVTETLPGIRFQSLHQLDRAMKMARRNPDARSPLLHLLNTLPGVNRRVGHSRAWHRVVYRDAERPDQQTMRELRRQFKPNVVALSEYLGRDFVALWGYDELD